MQSSNRRFWFAVVATCVLYGVLAAFSFRDVIYSVEMSQPATKSMIESGQLTSTSARDVFLLLCGAAALYLYVEGYLALKSRAVPMSIAQLLIACTAVTVVVFCTVPFDSTDTSVYINCGWLQTHYQVNPYGCSVSEISNWTGDPMLKEHWVHVTPIFGPVFTLLTKLVTDIGQQNYMLNVFLFKAICAVSHLLIANLVYLGASRIQTPSDCIRSVYLYAFSPLMLIHCVGNAHNDILNALFTCLAVVALLHRRWFLVFPALFASIGIKYASLVLIPGFAYLMIKQIGKSKTAASFAIGAIPLALLACVYIAPIDDKHFLAMLNSLNEGAGSIRALIALWQTPGLDSAIKLGTIFGCFALAISRIRKWNLVPTALQFERVMNDSTLFMVLLICVVSLRFNAWYPAMFLPLALFLSPQSRVRQFSLLFAGLLSFSIMWFGMPGTYMVPIFLMVAFVGSKFAANQSSLLRGACSSDILVSNEGASQLSLSRPSLEPLSSP